MKNKENLCLGIFLVSLFLIGIILFSGLNKEVNIKLENEKVIKSEVPLNYPISIVIFLIFLSCVCGITFMYYIHGLDKKFQLTKKTAIKC